LCLQFRVKNLTSRTVGLGVNPNSCIKHLLAGNSGGGQGHQLSEGYLRLGPADLFNVERLKGSFEAEDMQLGKNVRGEKVKTNITRSRPARTARGDTPPPRMRKLKKMGLRTEYRRRVEQGEPCERYKEHKRKILKALPSLNRIKAT